MFHGILKIIKTGSLDQLLTLSTNNFYDSKFDLI